MELRDYLAIGLKWLWLIVLATAIACAGAWVATKSMPIQYESRTTVIVGRAIEDPMPDWQAFYMSQSLASTYARMTTRKPVLDGVVNALGLDASWQQLKGMVKANEVPGSQLLEIRVIDTDPARAQVIADEVARQLIANSPTPSQRDRVQDQSFVEEQVAQLRTAIEQADIEIQEIDSTIALETSARSIADLQNRKAALQSKKDTWQARYAMLRAGNEGSAVNSLAVIEPAALGEPVGPNVKMNVLFAAALGFGLALAAILFLEYLDDTIKTADDVEKRLRLIGLATINLVASVTTRRDGLVSLRHPRSPAAEAFRMLRTNLQFSMLRHPHGALLVTSANPGEGKSTTAANLAVAIAQRGKRVVLVDSDLRKPALHRIFDLHNSLGMTSLLLDDSLTPDDALQPVEGVPGLQVLASGPLPPNPAEVLDSAPMQALLEQLKARADLVIMDSPPLLVVADGAILAGQVDGTLLVFDSGATHTRSAREAIDTLAKVGVKPIGAVVNRLDPDRLGGYYYAYSYKYRYGDYYGDDDGGGDGGGGLASAGVGERRGSIRRQPGWLQRLRDVVASLM